MSKTVTISAEKRNEQGTRAARVLRGEGKVPAILYGHGLENTMLCVSRRDLDNMLRTGGGHGLLQLSVNGVGESVVIKDIQFDVFGREPLHVDFARVSAGERISVEVPVVLKGTAPGIAEGGTLDFVMHSLEVECPAENIIEQIAININNLHLGQSIYVKDIPTSEGIKILNDPDVVVVHVVRKAQETEVEAEPTTSAEPELIRRPAAEKTESDE